MGDYLGMSAAGLGITTPPPNGQGPAHSSMLENAKGRGEVSDQGGKKSHQIDWYLCGNRESY